MEPNWDLVMPSLRAYREMDHQNNDINHAYSVDMSADLDQELDAAELQEILAEVPAASYTALALVEYMGNALVGSGLWQESDEISDNAKATIVHLITMVWMRLCHEALMHVDPENEPVDPPYLGSMAQLKDLAGQLPDFSDILNQFDN